MKKHYLITTQSQLEEACLTASKHLRASLTCYRTNGTYALPAIFYHIGDGRYNHQGVVPGGITFQYLYDNYPECFDGTTTDDYPELLI
jgi:hypothetical protein